MIGRLIALSLTQRLLVSALTLLLVIAGVQAWRSLPIDAFPDVSPTQVKIILKAPGMTPEEVETRIVAPIEIEMLGIPNSGWCARSPSTRSPTSPSTSRTAPTSTGRASRSAERLGGVLR
jgi:cobalt-zinc-cadmium resistance protein CzcA